MVQFGLLDSYGRLADSRWTKFTIEQIFWLIFDDFESIQIIFLKSNCRGAFSNTSWCICRARWISLNRFVGKIRMIDYAGSWWWSGGNFFWLALLFVLILFMIHQHTKRRMMLAWRTKMLFKVIQRVQYGSSASFGIICSVCDCFLCFASDVVRVCVILSFLHWFDSLYYFECLIHLHPFVKLVCTAWFSVVVFCKDGTIRIGSKFFNNHILLIARKIEWTVYFHFLYMHIL